jgi:hypothetical protein
MRKRGWVCLIVLGLGISLMFTGCATLNKQAARSTEDRLIAAGFTMKVPTTPEGEAKIKALKPLKIARGIKDGQLIYVYPDPYNCKCAYVGGEQQYAEYRRLSIQQQIAEDNLMAADMIETDPVGSAWWW